jgi:hypothetical protein
MSNVDNAHIAIGRAVCACQDFEIVLLVSVELFRMVTEPEYHELTQGNIPPSRFKTPTKNLLKLLAERNDIHPELESDIAELLEARHKVIHRWTLENGSAEREDSQYWLRYGKFALHVEGEAKRIASLLLSYILKWAEPEWAKANHDEYLVRMKKLFQDAATSAR